MKYLTLLRGINVGGNNKIEMSKLKTMFEELDLCNVKTYINTGNIIFEDEQRTQSELVILLEKAIVKNFNLAIKVLVIDEQKFRKITRTLPTDWANNTEMKCDVMFLWEEVDSPDVLDQLTIKPKIDDVKYTQGAIIWRVDRDKVTRSGLMKLVGTKLYKQMTIRNCNTVRQLKKLFSASIAEK